MTIADMGMLFYSETRKQKTIIRLLLQGIKKENHH